MHKVFLGFHQADLSHKTALLGFNAKHPTFIDGLVDTGDNSDSLSDNAIRKALRGECLRDTTVTVVLVAR